MKDKKILLYAGTTEGRKLASYLGRRGVRLHVCVATAYGESLLPEEKNITVTHDRMDSGQMGEFMRVFEPDYVIDATHPYAKEVTKNLKSACEVMQVPYLRLVRGSEETKESICVENMDEAIKYLNDNPDTICIVSGGQGYNEPCTEAQGMAEYLEKKGVPKVRILMETESTTTAQNISNSMQYIREGATVGIVTNNFHMFRALQIAKQQGLTQVCGIAAKSKPLYLPNNMLREYLAEIKYLFPTKPIRVILQTESKDIHSK